MRELFRELVVARECAKDEHDRGVTLAWQIEALHRTKKLPALTTLLARHRDQPQSVGQMRSLLHLLSEQHGGSLVRGKKTLKVSSRLKKTPTVVSGMQPQKGRRGQ